MENHKLHISGTSDTPLINFDSENGKLIMRGSSLPENITEFYNPVFDWLNDYIKNPHPNTIVEFSFNYLNTSSSNCVLRIIETLASVKDICNLEINWYYKPNDYDIRDLGNDLLDGIDIKSNISLKEELMSN